RVEKAERGGCQGLLFLALGCYGTDYIRRVPFRAKDLKHVVPQPLFKQQQLGGLAGAVYPLDYYKLAGDVPPARAAPPGFGPFGPRLSRGAVIAVRCARARGCSHHAWFLPANRL
ncbi:MAG: hypothetical protein MI749_19920, partial [Desulfovibrionales bacterium]|nr:hypothetical protein [Desulfovibrionales bacterium]